MAGTRRPDVSVVHTGAPTLICVIGIGPDGVSISVFAARQIGQSAM
jgi:hypothetical protein